MKILLLVLVFLSLFYNGQSFDQTLQRNVFGETLVDAVIEKIRSKCILAEDKNLLRRIAAVETDFGKKAGKGSGGIWKIDNFILVHTKSSCRGVLNSVCHKILRIFTFDIATARMSDMDVPLYSGLIMSAYITSLNKPVPAIKSDQADFWIRYINQNGSKTDFVKRSVIKFDCAGAKMELVFIIDASGSVTKKNFNKTLSFIQKVVTNLQIASDKTRVAVIRFSSNAKVAFGLGAHNSVASLTNAMSKIKYTGGGTSTSTALDLARKVVFKNSRKNVPKVLVLVTDGRSDNQNQTIIAADKLKKDAITIFTIGIGYINNYEIRAIASSPSCTHYYLLKSYQDIDTIITEIQRESCAVPSTIQVNPTNGTIVTVKDPLLPANESQAIHIKIPPSYISINGSRVDTITTVMVKIFCGVMEIYASHDFVKPSAVIHTYTATVTSINSGVIQYPADRMLYLTLVPQIPLIKLIGNCKKPFYNIIITTSKKVQKVVWNPCTKENILNNKIRFRHPKSTIKYIKCKGVGLMEVVECPKGTQYLEYRAECGYRIKNQYQNRTIYTGPSPCTRKSIMLRQFYFENPSDVSSFIQCDEWGIPYLINCRNSTVWSQPAYTCVHVDPVINFNISLCKSAQKNLFGYHENPGDRRTFIKCHNGTAILLRCPFGKVYSHANLACINETVNPGLNTTSNFTSTVAPTKAPVLCINGEYYPHKNPRKYYRCEWSKLRVLPCPGGLEWFQSRKVCDWPIKKP